MRILYSAIDQTVPGTTGGSVHVTAVAEGLAALGHDVHVLVTRGAGTFPSGPATNPVRWTAMSPPFMASQLRWMRTGAVRRIVAELQPQVVMERYYNFGGEAIFAAAAARARTVLEVNAPVVDYAGSKKALIDRALIVEPMRRWRERICERADLIVTPSAAILPPQTPSRKIARLEWGADTERFRPGISGEAPFARPAATVAIFAGAFRSWHGAINLVRAVRELRARGRSDIGAVFVGDGPELACGAGRSRGSPRHRHRRRCPARADARVSRGRRHRRRPIRDWRPSSAVPRVLLVAAQDFRVHGRRPPRRRTRRRSDSGDSGQ